MTREEITASTKFFAACSALFMLIFTSLRVYEFSLIHQRVEHASLYEWIGYLYDWTTACGILVVVFGLHFSLSLVNLRTAKICTISLFAIVIAASFGLIQYFSVPLVPLSTDLFGYSWSDIIITVRSSGGFSVITMLSLLLYLTLFVCGSIWLSRLTLLRKLPASVAIGFLIVAATVAFVRKKPSPQQYEHERAYSLVVNKSSYFIDRTINHIVLADKPEIAIKPYPFLRDFDYKNVLADHLGSTSVTPDIVFIIVEGLGSDFMAGGTSAGFTPFLDSLATKGLYWKNALSNAGRTFGVLPSVLGSLPYGKRGFMDYGAEMPDHQTIVSLLKPFGYKSSFFYGGTSNFDNQDVFLEYQGVDFLLDNTKFPGSFKKMQANNEGFSWGYADRHIFDYALEQSAGNTNTPQLHVYLTLSTHEPFKTPEQEYERLFEEQLAHIDLKSRQKYVENRNVFSCLLYTDDVLRTFFHKYKQRREFKNTIFIITGDHRLMPVSHDTRLSRFRVPILIFSPLQKKSREFRSLAIHSDITPTILAYLSANYGFTFPRQMPFISGPLSVQENFSSNLDLALIRNKNETIDYIEHDWLLSDNRLFKILPDLALKPQNDVTVKKRLQRKLTAFKASSQFACENNQLDKPKHTHQNFFTFSEKGKKYLEKHSLDQRSPEEIFEEAKSMAFREEFTNSRVILKSLLNRSPNYHDARTLLARTYGWTGDYDSARWHLNATLKRAPYYADGYVALADVEYWAGRNDEALKIAENALILLPQNTDLQIRKARSLWLTGQVIPAKEELQRLLLAHPGHTDAGDLFQKITNENN